MFRINLYLRLVKYFFSLGVALGIGLIYVLTTVPLHNDNHKPALQCSTEALVLYQKLKTEMTLTDVQSFLGPGSEVESTRDTVTFVWHKNSNLSIIVTFQDGKLIRKQKKGC